MALEAERSVGFDARQQFHPVFIKLMGFARESAIRQDWSTAYRCWAEFYGMARPFLSEKETEKIDSLVKEGERLDNNLRVVKDAFRPSVLTRLRELTRKLDYAVMDASKEHALLLPIGAEEDEEPDWDAIRKRGRV